MTSRASWQSSLANAFRDVHELAAFLDWPLDESVSTTFPVLVPRALAQQIKDQGPNAPLALQFLPHAEELAPLGLVDPIGDQAHAKTTQLIHRYHNRALLIPTTVCPVHCRYCFRKNELSDDVFKNDRAATLAYLSAHTEIEEVIFTGGDPLMLSDDKLREWLNDLAQIPHLEFVRFHTRFPVILPERLTPELALLFETFAERFRILLVVHTNHASEWSPEALRIAQSFRPQGLRWLSQSVLLKGVNDSTMALAELFRLLARTNIEAYYLHHPDQVKGAMHFWLSLEEGRRIWAKLHDQLPGWMLPQYVIDVPGGHGKISAVNPETHTFSGTLLSRQGLPIQLTTPLN